MYPGYVHWAVCGLLFARGVQAIGALPAAGRGAVGRGLTVGRLARNLSISDNNDDR